MSKISRVRIINLNYNNNAMKVDDELFHLNGESTLLSLRNGGGKSVLVQIIMAPFVNQRYRNMKHRAFSSYFTSNTPTYILVEWELEGAASHVLTGMMVRKRVYSSDEDSKDELEIINFIHEYTGHNKYDISNIPLVEVEEGRKKVRSFGNSKQLFENLKKDRSYQFNYYDMGSPSQTRSYFDKLKEYRINNKEWESIMWKLNLRESGLSELFTDCKNAAGLTEKWFLKTVEDKLNKDEDKIKNFREIVLRYSKQYKENKTKIDKRKAIEEFFEDGEGIREKTLDLKRCREKTSAFENRIANLTAHLDQKHEEMTQMQEKLNKEISDIIYEIEDIGYEKLSLEIHKSRDEEEKLIKIFEELERNLEREKLQKSTLEMKRNILECAKIYREYQDFSKEVQGLEIQLEILKKKNEDLAPERNNLGYTLKRHYEHEHEKVLTVKEEIEERMHFLDSEKKNSERNIKSLNEQLNGSSLEMGEMKARLKAFDEAEKRFNEKYQESFARNITGYYGSSLLQEAELNYEKQLEASKKRIAELNKFLHEKEEEARKKDRDEKDYIDKNAKARESLSRTREELEQYEKQLEELRDILKYIDFSEERLFDKEEIISEFNRKTELIKDEQLKLNFSLQKEREELRKLQTGKIAELPPEIEAEFIKRDIHIVYGIEWLRKNSNSVEVNEELVKNNPFIPYSLIMPSRDIEKLEKEPVESFTSYPVLIIRREDLDNALTQENCKVITLGKVSFLVSFNSRLIDENELISLIENKKLEIDELESRLQERQESLDFYEHKRNTVIYSIVDRKKYNETKDKEKTLAKEIEDAEKTLYELRKEIGVIRKSAEEAESELKRSTSEEEFLGRKLETLKELKEKYNEYCKSKEKYAALEEEMEDIRGKIYEEETNVRNLTAEKSSQEDRRRDYIQKADEINRKINIYAGCREGSIIEKDIEDIEARYESITKNISDDEKSLETQLEKANSRFKAKETELTEKQKEYSLEECQFREEQYDLFKEKQLKKEIRNTEENIASINKKLNGCSTEKALIRQNTENCLKDLKKNFHRENPKDRSEIKEINFDEKISGKEYEKKELEKVLEKLLDKIRKVESNSTSLAEYSHFRISEETDIQVEVNELDRFRGELVRDYRASLQAGSESKGRLDKEIERVIRKEIFSQDDFFRKPLDKLEELSQDPDYLLENLNITISSYNSLLEKLKADIELINKEKENVLQNLFDYIFEIHENIGKIDRNSSINIRGRSIKMLRIIMPVWEDNKALYRLKLNDLLERVTDRALDRMEKNENAEEIISTEITTKNLYNEVVSISSIEIKLYKIEEEREYPISWDEVYKNSGGEGFLSAFVILSSLLSYMRRDDTDIFAEKESSKVLLMDNPFAQTNSEHLLKPLIEIAKKSNTQLICLSGLGGDSIYNRFDNIYVLNLISSKLKGGMQFLKGEHRKGGEPSEVMVSSNFRITEEIEQMELF